MTISSVLMRRGCLQVKVRSSQQHKHAWDILPCSCFALPCLLRLVSFLPSFGDDREDEKMDKDGIKEGNGRDKDESEKEGKIEEGQQNLVAFCSCLFSSLVSFESSLPSFCSPPKSGVSRTQSHFLDTHFYQFSSQMAPVRDTAVVEQS